MPRTASLLLVLLFGCGSGREQPPTDAASMQADARVAAVPDSAVVEDASTSDASTPQQPAGPPGQTDQLADGVVGSACSADVDCGDGRCSLKERVTGTPYPDGYCTGRCREDAHCGARGLCVPGFLGAIGSCALRCEQDADCGRSGYRCRTVDGVGRCAAGPEPLPDGVVGNSCSSDTDCGSGALTCASSLANNPTPDGYCSQKCAIDADCGAGGTCINGIQVVTLATGTCYRACAAPDDCRSGYDCRSLSGGAEDGQGVCAPQQAVVDDAGSP